MEPDIAVTVGMTVGTETGILMGVYVGFGTFAYAQTISCEVAGVAVPKMAALTGEVIMAKATSPPPIDRHRMRSSERPVRLFDGKAFMELSWEWESVRRFHYLQNTKYPILRPPRHGQFAV